MLEYTINKINITLDNYYINPYKFKFTNDINSNIFIDNNDSNDNDISEIIKTLTSIIMSNNESNNYKNNIIKFDSNLNLNIKSDNKLLENFDKSTDKYNNFNLFKFIANNNIKQLENILNNNYLINVNIQDEDGDCPLHLSVFLYNLKACELLINNGASLIIKDKWGQIPIHRLCFCSGEINSIKIINLFNYNQIKTNLNFNIFNSVDNYGNTSFHLVLNYFIKNKFSIKT